MSATSPSLVAPDVVFLSAVRLLEALQNAELCDPGILMAYPRGNVELVAPQASRKRFFAKKQSLPHSADQTFTSIPVTCTDTGIPGVGLSYLSTSPPPLSIFIVSLARPCCIFVCGFWREAS